MKIARIARTVAVVALAWRVIADRRRALARERRARRIAPLLIAAGGTGAILATRPRTLEVARRFWDLARRQWNSKTSNSDQQGDLGRPGGALPSAVAPMDEIPAQSLPEERARVDAPAGLERKGSRKKRRSRAASGSQSTTGKRKPSYAVKAKGEEPPAPGTETGESH